MANTNMNRIPTNGNCKAIRDITNNKRYGSMTEAAMANGVTLSAMSMAVNKGKLCNGSLFMLEKDLHKNVDKLCENAAKANARAVKAEVTHAEMEEFRRWKAEQEAARKAKEEHDKAVAKAEEKVERCWSKYFRRKELLDGAQAELSKAQRELELLKGNREEVA